MAQKGIPLPSVHGHKKLEMEPYLHMASKLRTEGQPGWATSLVCSWRFLPFQSMVLPQLLGTLLRA